MTTLIGGRPAGSVRRWAPYALLALTATAYLGAAHLPGPWSPPWTGLDAGLLAVAHAVPALVCLARGRDRSSPAWWALGAALLLRGVAQPWAEPATEPAAALLGAAALLCTVGVVWLVQPSGPRSRTGLDTLLALAAVASAALGLAPQIRSLGHGVPAAGVPLVGTAGPLADLALLVVAGCGVAVTRRFGRDVQLVGLGVLLHAASVLAPLLLPAAGDDALHRLPGGLLILAALGLVAAARTGSAGDPDAPVVRGAVGRVTGHWVSWAALALPAGCVGLCVAVLALGQVWAMPTVALLLANAGMALVMLRFLLTVREIQRLADGHLQARTDDLTGLANRRSLYEHCDAVLPQVTAASPLALVLLDLDRFKEVNDTLGPRRRRRPALARSGRGSPPRSAADDLSPGSAATSSRCCCRATRRREAGRRTGMPARAQPSRSRSSGRRLQIVAPASASPRCPTTARTAHDAAARGRRRHVPGQARPQRLARLRSEHEDPEQPPQRLDLLDALCGDTSRRRPSSSVHYQPQVGAGRRHGRRRRGAGALAAPAARAAAPGAFLPLAEAAGLMRAR